MVRSPTLQASQRQALERQLLAAEADLATVLVARRGKGRPTTSAGAEMAVATILDRRTVQGLLDVTVPTSRADPGRSWPIGANRTARK